MSKQPAREVLRDNLDRLMSNHGLIAKTLQPKTGVGRSTINNIRHNAINATVNNVEALADALGVPTWAMFLPDLDVAVKGHELEELLSCFLASSPEGRTALVRLAAFEAAREDR